jgi:molybdopterin synthase sulfur carrier subunit
MPDSGPATAVITIRLVYLARLRDAFGGAGEALALTAGERTVGDVLRTLRARPGAWPDELAPQRAVRVAVNHALARPDTVLRDGDEVALLPPVTGG